MKIYNTKTVKVRKGVINLDEANQDSIGNNAIATNSMWVGSHYLNVLFDIRVSGNRKHLVNLVVNRLIAPVDDGYAYLEFRYNNQGESVGILTSGLVSFDLGGYGLSNSGYKGLKVKVNDVKGGEQTLVFNYQDSGGNEKQLSISDLTDTRDIE